MLVQALQHEFLATSTFSTVHTPIAIALPYAAAQKGINGTGKLVKQLLADDFIPNTGIVVTHPANRRTE